MQSIGGGKRRKMEREKGNEKGKGKRGGEQGGNSHCSIFEDEFLRLQQLCVAPCPHRSEQLTHSREVKNPEKELLTQRYLYPSRVHFSHQHFPSTQIN